MHGRHYGAWQHRLDWAADPGCRARFSRRFRVVALAARGNIALLAEQAREFAPEIVAYTSDDPATQAQAAELLPNALHGIEGLTIAATHPAVTTVVAATSGLIGLRPDAGGHPRGQDDCAGQQRNAGDGGPSGDRRGAQRWRGDSAGG